MKKFIPLIVVTSVAIVVIAATTFVPISQQAHWPSPTNGLYIPLAKPGITNGYITVGEFLTFINTNLGVSNGNTASFSYTNINIFYGQTNIKLDFGTAKYFDLISINNSTNHLYITLTNNIPAANRVFDGKISFYILGTNNLSIVWPTNLGWVSQLGYNGTTYAPTSLVAGTFCQVIYTASPYTNILSVNP